MSRPKETWKDYVATYGGTEDSHFELGSAALSDEGRDVIGWLAATELAALRSRGTEVFALGSADRVDTAWYNELLSTLRAENTLQALKDAVGPTMRAKTNAQGLGETLPAGANQPDGHENPEFRRVWLSFSGQSVATLKGGKST